MDSKYNNGLKVYHSIEQVEKNTDRFISVGSFDGLHSGHLSIIQEMKSQSNGNEILLITFDPHPQLIVKNPLKQNIELLTGTKEKLEIFEEIGVDAVLVINFTKEFSELQAESFIEDILIKQIGFSKIFIGYDHLFGKDRKGSIELINKLSSIYNFEAVKIEPHIEDEIIVSSTYIRSLIKERNIEEANKMLGRNYSISGTVVTGNMLGRQIGFPTINIEPEEEHKLLPALGVYLAKVYHKNHTYFGMANIGFRPTLTDDIKPTLEINLFDFEQDVYGDYVKAEFLKYIRAEKKFTSVDELCENIEKDKQRCKDFIKFFE